MGEPQGRFERLTPAGSVRCACDACGAHLFGRPDPGGGCSGVCLVCGGEEVSPLQDPAAGLRPAG